MNQDDSKNLILHSGQIPPVSREDERTAARERRAAFPYRFPRYSRKLGGQFTVDENARRLQRFFISSAA